jgi:hypothetical protein
MARTPDGSGYRQAGQGSGVAAGAGRPSDRAGRAVKGAR